MILRDVNIIIVQQFHKWDLSVQKRDLMCMTSLTQSTGLTLEDLTYSSLADNSWQPFSKDII